MVLSSGRRALRHPRSPAPGPEPRAPPQPPAALELHLQKAAARRQLQARAPVCRSSWRMGGGMGLPCSTQVLGDRPEEAGRTPEHPPPPNTHHWGLLAPVAEVEIEQVPGAPGVSRHRGPPVSLRAAQRTPNWSHPHSSLLAGLGGLLTPELSIPGPQSLLPSLGAGEASESTPPHTPSRYQSLRFVFALFRLCVTLPKGLPQLVRTTRLYLL